MEYITVDVYLPARERSFDVRIPCAMNTLLAAHLAARALSGLSEGTYLPSRSSVFAQRETGALLDMRKTMAECGVTNGSRLLLI